MKPITHLWLGRLVRITFCVWLSSGLYAQGQTFSAPAAHDSWTLGKPMPTARSGMATGVINGKVYVVGGATSKAVIKVNEVYDPANDQWTKAAAMPTARFVPASAVVNNILYVIGGCNGGGCVGGWGITVVEAYDPVSNAWSRKAPLPVATDSMYAVAEKGIIYVIGGYVHRRKRVAAVWSYDPVADHWTKKAPLKVGKSLPAVGLLGSTIVAAGGLANRGVVADNEGYNAVKNLWRKLASDPTARQGGCAWGISGQLYFAGGGASPGGDPLSVLEAYNLKKNSWITSLASMPNAVVNPGSAYVGNQLFCFGGSDYGNPFTGTNYDYVQIYQP